MNRRTAIAAFAGGVAGLRAAEPSRTPVLVELFTSEGCSSCPPADRLLTHLEHNPPEGVEIIALSEHVDYWNHLGWEDPFSSSLFSARQHHYSMRFRKESVYTPQVVINGRVEALGSDASAVHAAIAQASAQPPQTAVRVRRRPGEDSAIRIQIEVAALPAGVKEKRWNLMLAMTESGLVSSVTRGENTGRRLPHTGVVRQLNRIAELEKLQGNSYSAEIKAPMATDWKREELKAVVFVQSPGSQTVIGAGSCRLL